MSIIKSVTNYRTKIIAIALTACVSALAVAAAPGDLDAAFNPGLGLVRYTFSSTRQTSVNKILVQPDGKFLAIGNFQVSGKYVRNGVVRFNSDGTIDTTFGPPDFENNFLGTSGTVNTGALQPDGKILIGFTNDVVVSGQTRRGILRLNADGSLDTSFNILADPNNSFSGYVETISVDANNKIVIGGFFTLTISGNGTRQNVARVLADGTPDPSFNVQPVTTVIVRKVLSLASGKTLITGLTPSQTTSIVARLNSDGSSDSSFALATFGAGTGIPVETIGVQADNKILVGGSFQDVNGFPIPRGLARINENGSVDGAFNTANAGISGNIKDLMVLPDAKILIGGSFVSYNNVNRKKIAVVSADGSLFNPFEYTGDVLTVNAVAGRDDGSVLAGSEATATMAGITPPLFKLTSAGASDPSFAPGIAHFAEGRTVFVQPDGKILVGGLFTNAAGGRYSNVVRFNPDGTPDQTFTPPIFTDTTVIQGIDVRASDGKILIGRSNGVSMLNPDGTVFSSALAGGFCPSVKFLPGSGFLAVGNDYLRRVSDAGVVDFSFDVRTVGFIYKILLQPDGKILIAGDFTSVKGVARGRIARLNSDGTLDMTFSAPGGANAIIYEMGLQSDGKVVIGGAFTGVNFDTNKRYLARFNPDGSLDNSFGATVNNQISSVKIQTNGNILIAGSMNLVNGVPRDSMARLFQNGSLDFGFNLGPVGANNLIWGMDFQNNGDDIVIAGAFSRIGGIDRLGVARLDNMSVVAPNRAPFDFDGDNKTDISVFRPSNGQWWYLRSSDGGNRAFQFGSQTDRVVSADFTGDGKADIGFWRESTGEWFILRSEDSSFYSFPFGAMGDIPAPADYDGDGKADPAIFRQSNATWYILQSSGGTVIKQFGASGDRPVSGDYDGDGKADTAIFRPSNGQWWIDRSTAGVIATNFGTGTDRTVQGDYTGDGKADVAFYRPSSGEWFILRSENASFYSFPFGAAGDIAAPGDYDGDGRIDAAVFRPSNNTWYKLQSTSGFEAITFGIAGDLPVPNAFVR